MSVIGRLIKANAVGSEITPPDDSQLLVVNPSTNRVDRATVAAIRGSQSITDAEQIRDALEGLPVDDRLNAEAIQGLPTGISETQANRISDLWNKAPHVSPIIFHLSFQNGHYASSWSGYNTGVDLTSAGVLGTLQHSDVLDLATITTNQTGTAEVVTIVNTNNRHLYWGISPDVEHSSVFKTGVRMAIVYAGEIVFDRPLTDFTPATQRTVAVSDAVLSQRFLDRPDNSVVDFYLYYKDDQSTAASIEDLLTGNVLPANLDAVTAEGTDPSTTQGLVEREVGRLIDRKILAAPSEFDIDSPLVTDIRLDDRFYIQRAGETGLKRVALSTILDLALRSGHRVIPPSENATSISVTHNFGRYPVVIAVQSDGTELVGAVTHRSVNAFEITFDVEFAGTLQWSI